MTNFTFKLNFDELDEELKEQKIDDAITYLFENGEYEDDKRLNYYLDDPKTRSDVRQYIEAHFPVYF